MSMKFSFKSKKAARLVSSLLTISGSERRRAVNSPHLFSLQDWRYILLETRLSLIDKKIPIFSAGAAFYAALAFFPMLAAIVAIGAYTLDVHRLEAILSIIKNYFPIDVAALLGSHLRNAFQYNLRNVGVAIVAILIALYSATRAMYILVSSMNTVYEQRETRSGVQLIGLCFAMALGAMVVIALSLALVLVDQTTLKGAPTIFADTLPFVRWILLAFIIAISLSVFYRVAPSGHDPRWRWVSWGAGIASIIWLAGTTLFFLYAKYISIYGTIYNVFGSVIVLLIWLNLSSFIILLGAQINHRLEARTTLRTTR